MSTSTMNEYEKEQNELALKQIAGKPQHIEINERTLEAYRAEYTKKGCVITKEEEYDQESFHLVKKLKAFDSLVDPTQGIRKVITSMVRQPVTVFNKQGKPEVKDALYYYGNYYGVDKKGNDLGAEFQEGYFKKPKLVFSSIDPANPFDSKTGERRGEYKQSGSSYEYYIFLPDKQADIVKFLNDIIQNAPGTFIGNLGTGGHLSYRNPAPDNGRSGGHGGSFTWQIFTELSLEELGELQNKNYYTEKSTGQIKDRTGQRVAYDHSTKKVETTKDR
jgi:hypothetical protein